MPSHADQHVALVRRQRGAVGGDEARRDGRIALLDADAAVAGDEVLRPEALAYGIQEDLVQVGAMNGKMRPLVSGRDAPWLAVDELAVAGEEGVVLRLAGDRGERGLEPERLSSFTAWGPRLIPTPSGRISGAASNTRMRAAAFAAWAASASVSPPMPPPMMINSTRRSGSTRQLISHIPMVLWNLPNRAAGCNIACASKDVH